MLQFSYFCIKSLVRSEVATHWETPLKCESIRFGQHGEWLTDAESYK